MLSKKKRHGRSSPAACLLPQIEASIDRRYGQRRREVRYRERGASPGKLFTYVSAGNIELPKGRGEVGEPVRVSGIRSLIILAFLLVLIWLIF